MLRHLEIVSFRLDLNWVVGGTGVRVLSGIPGSEGDVGLWRGWEVLGRWKGEDQRLDCWVICGG